MTRSLHLQIRILAMLLFAVAIIRPMGFVQTHDALASPTAAPTVLYFVYDFVVYGLCAWGLLRRQVWARWIAIVLTSRIAIANIARLPLEANESALPPPPGLLDAMGSMGRTRHCVGIRIFHVAALGQGRSTPGRRRPRAPPKHLNVPWVPRGPAPPAKLSAAPGNARPGLRSGALPPASMAR